MSSPPGAYRRQDSYEPIHLAVTLLEMSAIAEREARVRWRAAEASRTLGKLNVQVEEFETAAAVLEETSARVAVCACRLGQLAKRLTGLSAWS